MKKLTKYAQKSKLMDISIKLGDESFRFNLYEELIVNENIINKEIESHSTIAGFLSTLYIKLDRRRADLEVEMERIYHRLFVKAKGEITNSGRPPSDDLAKSMVIANKKYQLIQARFLDAKEHAQILKACVNRFEERAYLIQTLSANIRKSN